jgi:hypothetical protein
LSFEIYIMLTIISSFIFTAGEQNYFDMITQQLDRVTFLLISDQEYSLCHT